MVRWQQYVPVDPELHETLDGQQLRESEEHCLHSRFNISTRWRHVAIVVSVVCAVALLTWNATQDLDEHSTESQTGLEEKDDVWSIFSLPWAQDGNISTNTTTATTATTVTATITKTTISTTSVTRTTTGTTTTAPFSLFCWTLVVSNSSEHQLLKHHYELGINIFACDSFLVVSDFPISLAPGVSSVAIGALHSKRAPWNSWYNVPEFLRAWDAVMGHSRANKSDWTVKVDADTFFCVGRLKHKLWVQHVPNEEASFWINYDAAHLPGPLDFLGPLEVFSRRAMELFQEKGKEVCPNPKVQTLGEDGFMKNCMYRLGAKARYDYSLLLNACDWCQPVDPHQCSESRYAAFHPFKNISVYTRCLHHAGGAC